MNALLALLETESKANQRHNPDKCAYYESIRIKVNNEDRLRFNSKMDVNDRGYD